MCDMKGSRDCSSPRFVREPDGADGGMFPCEAKAPDSIFILLVIQYSLLCFSLSDKRAQLYK